MSDELAKALRVYADARDQDVGWGTGLTYTMRDAADRIDRYRTALAEIARRERRSEYSSIYAAPSEFARIAKDALIEP